MDVFPEVILISDAQTVNLPDFDIAVAFNRAVNEAGCPVVVFGWAQGQRLHTPPGLKV